MKYTAITMATLVMMGIALPVSAQSTGERMADQEARPVAYTVAAQAREVAAQMKRRADLTESGVPPAEQIKLTPEERIKELEEKVAYLERADRMTPSYSPSRRRRSGGSSAPPRKKGLGWIVLAGAGGGALAGAIGAAESRQPGLLIGGGAAGGAVGGSIMALGIDSEIHAVTVTGVVLMLVSVIAPIAVATQ